MATLYTKSIGFVCCLRSFGESVIENGRIIIRFKHSALGVFAHYYDHLSCGYSSPLFLTHHSQSEESGIAPSPRQVHIRLGWFLVFIFLIRLPIFTVRPWFVRDFWERMESICQNKHFWWDGTFSTVKIWATSKLRNGLHQPPTPWQIQMPWLICWKEMSQMFSPWSSLEDGSTGPFLDLLPVRLSIQSSSWKLYVYIYLRSSQGAISVDSEIQAHAAERCWISFTGCFLGLICFLVLLECLWIEEHLLTSPWRKQWWIFTIFKYIQLEIYNVYLYTLVAADQTKAMADQMSGAAMAMPQDPKAAFKAEWESLEIVQHQWALKNVEAELLGITATSHSKTD